jgi:hypothetical protein
MWPSPLLVILSEMRSAFLMVDSLNIFVFPFQVWKKGILLNLYENIKAIPSE